MDKTRASLRRVRIYAALLLICGIYAALPHDYGAKAQAREWVSHIWRLGK